MAHFVPNPLLAQHLTRSRAMKEKLEELGGQIADRYRAGVPVDEGDLRDSIFSTVELEPERGYVGRVGATDWKAGLVEFGTADTPPDGSLRAAVEELGLELEVES